MKLGMSEIIGGIEQVAMNKITNSLTEQGFVVRKDYTLSRTPPWE